MSKKKKVKLILYDSYIKAIKNSVGSNLFRNLYAYLNNKKQDITKNGRLSCALHTSSLLLLFGLISKPHSTVDGVIKDLKRSGWILIKKPRKGAILVWERKNGHKHIGFYIGNNKAISNSFLKRKPILHHWTFGTKNSRSFRKIEQIFWNNKIKKINLKK